MSSTTMKTTDLSAEVLVQTCAQGDFFGLLALMLDFHTLHEIYEGLVTGSLVDDATTIGAELGIKDPRFTIACAKLKTFMNEEASNGYVVLRQEYTRLFDNPSAPALAFYEGAFVNRRSESRGKDAPDHDLLFINQAACDADRQYKRAGVKRAEDKNIPGDCMLTEMAFMQYLHEQKAQSLLEGSKERHDEVDMWLAEFTRLHLKTWMKDFFIACHDLSTHSYFQALGLFGQVLESMVLEEAK